MRHPAQVRRALPLLLLAAAAVTAGCGADGTSSAPAQEPPAPRLTLGQAIGQRFVFPYGGAAPPRRLEQRIRRGEAAGVILFGRNVRSVAQVRRVVRRLQAIPRPAGLDAPLLVLVDQEGGPVRRLPGSPRRAAAQMRTAGTAGSSGAAAGRLLRSAGVNVDLAPVADVGRPRSALRRERRDLPGRPRPGLAPGRRVRRGPALGGRRGRLQALPRLRGRHGEHRRRPRADRRAARARCARSTCAPTARRVT